VEFELARIMGGAPGNDVQRGITAGLLLECGVLSVVRPHSVGPGARGEQDAFINAQQLACVLECPIALRVASDLRVGDGDAWACNGTGELLKVGLRAYGKLGRGKPRAST